VRGLGWLEPDATDACKKVHEQFGRNWRPNMGKCGSIELMEILTLLREPCATCIQAEQERRRYMGLGQVVVPQLVCMAIVCVDRGMS